MKAKKGILVCVIGVLAVSVAVSVLLFVAVPGPSKNRAVIRDSNEAQVDNPHLVVRQSESKAPAASADQTSQESAPANKSSKETKSVKGWISGTVMNASGQPVEGAKVEAKANVGANKVSLLSAADGSFKFDGMQPTMTLVLWAEKDGLICRLAPRAAAIGISSLALFLSPPCSIAGWLKDSKNQPLPDTELGLYTDYGDELSVLTPNAEGRFSVNNLYPGKYTVRVGKHWERMELNAGEDKNDIALIIDKKHRFTISGRIVDMHGTPVWDARVTAMNENLKETSFRSLPNTLTDHEGFYRIWGLMAGLHELRISRRDHNQVIRAGVPAGSVNVNLILNLSTGKN